MLINWAAKPDKTSCSPQNGKYNKLNESNLNQSGFHCNRDKMSMKRKEVCHKLN